MSKPTHIAETIKVPVRWRDKAKSKRHRDRVYFLGEVLKPIGPFPDRYHETQFEAEVLCGSGTVYQALYLLARLVGPLPREWGSPRWLPYDHALRAGQGRFAIVIEAIARALRDGKRDHKLEREIGGAFLERDGRGMLEPRDPVTCLGCGAELVFDEAHEDDTPTTCSAECERKRREAEERYDVEV